MAIGTRLVLQDSRKPKRNCNEECHAPKGKQTCSCFEAQLKFANFFILQQKMSQHIVFYLVFNEDSKMGSAIFVPFVF
jgi:hypothetical protein